MYHHSPLFRVLCLVLVLLFAFQTVEPAVAFAAGPAKDAAAEPGTALKSHRPFVKSDLEERFHKSKTVQEAARHFGKKLAEAEGIVAIGEDGHQLAIVPYAGTGNGSALVYGPLPSGEDFAVNIEVLKGKGGTKVRYSDETGAGVVVDLEIQGDKFLLKNGALIDKKTGYLDGAIEGIVGVREAQAFTWACWMNCVVKICPTWSWCWWKAGIGCGVCLGTLGAGCLACFYALGDVAYTCRSRC